MTIQERYKKIEPSEIDTDLTYVGYYWLSDKQTPTVLDKETFDFDTLFKDSKRFVVEGNLYNKDEEISYQIKDIDGTPHISKIMLKGLVDLTEKELAKKNCKEVAYHTHDIPNFSKYTMIEAWMESDLYAKGMVTDNDLKELTTLVPAWSAFIGFNN